MEPYLARQRARMANRLISPTLRKGAILDIGCGGYPYFLAHTSFSEKFGIDNLPATERPLDIVFHALDLNSVPALPFPDERMSAVTMLAVVEHLNPTSLVQVFKEIHRVLTPDGQLIITTPAAWSASLLRLLARLSLVSKEEIDEHVYAYTLPLLGWYFGSAGFAMERLRFGYFELGLNMWAIAVR